MVLNELTPDEVREIIAKERFFHYPSDFDKQVRTSKEVSRVPEVVPEGKILVHNHVYPAFPIGLYGFRAWLDDTGTPEREICKCGCWPIEHYRVKGLGTNAPPPPEFALLLRTTYLLDPDDDQSEPETNEAFWDRMRDTAKAAVVALRSIEHREGVPKDIAHALDAVSTSLEENLFCELLGE